MKARVAGIAGSVLALTVIGGFAAASTFQPAPDSVQQVQVATVEPTVAPTVEPVVVLTTQAPAPVESTSAPAPVVAPVKVVVVPKVVAPAPLPTAQTAPAPGEGPQPILKDARGIILPPPPILGNAPQIDGHGVPIPTPTQ